MENEKLVQFFYSSKLVSQRIAEEIASHFTQKTVLKNNFHLIEGHHSNEYLFLETGFRRSYAYDVDGNEARQTSFAKTRLFLKYPHFLTEPFRKKIQQKIAKQNWRVINNFSLAPGINFIGVTKRFTLFHFNQYSPSPYYFLISCPYKFWGNS